MLLRSLPEDPLFRQELPHFDNAREYEAHLRKLADRLHALIIRPETAEQARQDHRERSFRDSLRGFTLPACDPARFYRVRWLQAQLLGQNDNTLLQTFRAKEVLSADEAKVAEWMISRDYFAADSLEASFDTLEPARLAAIVAKLIAAGLIESL